jgi:hypothetical protein
MKNAVFWDIKPQFAPHKKHITPLLQSPTGAYLTGNTLRLRYRVKQVNAIRRFVTMAY